MSTPTTLPEILGSGRVTLTQAETARILGIDRRTVAAAIASGAIPAVKYGRRVLVLAQPLARILGVPETHEEGGP